MEKAGQGKGPHQAMINDTRQIRRQKCHSAPTNRPNFERSICAERASAGVDVTRQAWKMRLPAVGDVVEVQDDGCDALGGGPMYAVCRALGHSCMDSMRGYRQVHQEVGVLHECCTCQEHCS